MRSLVRSGSSAVLVLGMMFIGSLVLWVGLPLGCLYLGSRVQGATQSLGVALLAMAGGLVAGPDLIRLSVSQGARAPSATPILAMS